MCRTQHGSSCCLPAALCPPGALIENCAGHLKIGCQITADRHQGQVEFTYRTDWTQVLTTILWGGRIDDVSRRILTNALRATADERHPVRIHAFAAAARDLLRHTLQTLAVRRKSRARRRCFGHLNPVGVSDDLGPAAAPPHDDLLAAINDLPKVVCLRPRVTIPQGAQADGSLQEALSALRGLSDLIDNCLEQFLQPLALRIGRHAVRTFILEIRREVDELAACQTVGDVYVESLTIAEPGDKPIRLEVEGFLGIAVPGGS